MKVAVVTGATSGIGKEVVTQLLRLGQQVVLTGRNKAKVEAAQADLAAMGLNADAFTVDIADAEQVAQLAGYVREKYGKLDVLVNNAGVFLDTRGKPQDKIEIVRQSFEINTLGAFRTIEALLPLLKKSGDARIVNVSSGMGGLTEMNGGSPGYRVSKAALNAVTRIFANDLAHDKISVNSICPGWVKTQMGGAGATRGVDKGAETIVWLATAEKIPNGKFLRDKKEIAW